MASHCSCHLHRKMCSDKAQTWLCWFPTAVNQSLVWSRCRTRNLGNETGCWEKFLKLHRQKSLMIDGREVIEQRQARLLAGSRIILVHDSLDFFLWEQGQEIRSGVSDRCLQLTVWLKAPPEQVHCTTFAAGWTLTHTNLKERQQGEEFIPSPTCPAACVSCC